LFSSKECLICEKTAFIYKLPPYQNLINTSEGSTKLKEKLKNDPEKFDIIQFEDDQIVLYNLLNEKKKGVDRRVAFYPGPFKLLILSDGTMVHRGRINNISTADIENLRKIDSIFEFQTDKVVNPVFYQDEYDRVGSRCLLISPEISEKVNSDYETNLNALPVRNIKLTARLISMIEHERKYFILIGSDPSDLQGCCPSEEVGEANRLVMAGILSSVFQNDYGDACPLTYYSFKGEIQTNQNDIEFEINKDLRKTVLYLIKKSKSIGIKWIKWILLGFVILSMVLAVLKLKDSLAINEQSSLYEQFLVTQENSILILLFHNMPRCNLCMNMEKHINSLLDENYGELLSREHVKFIPVNMKNTEYQELTRRFRLYTVSVVMVQFVDNKERKVKVLRDIWKVHDNRDLFKKELNGELLKLLSN
jgi:hypothetical protein